jgi:hypothetical protein
VCPSLVRTQYRPQNKGRSERLAALLDMERARYDQPLVGAQDPSRPRFDTQRGLSATVCARRLRAEH